MKNAKFHLFALCAVFLTSANFFEKNASAWSIPSTETPNLESRKHFENVTQFLLKQNKVLVSSDDKSTTGPFFPFGVGHLLSVLKEQTFWNVSRNEILETLQIPDESITPTYVDLMGRMSMLMGFGSHITSWDKYLTPNDNLDKLYVRLENNQFLSNQDLKIDGESKVNGTNSDSMQVQWIELSRKESVNYRPAKIANTMYIPNLWVQPFAILPEKKSFNNETKSVQFLQSKGFYRSYSTEQFDAVSLPLVSHGHDLVLIKLKDAFEGNASQELSSVLSHLWDISPKSSRWIQKKLLLTVPELNYILGAKVKTAGNVSCHRDFDEPDLQLQPVTQASYVYFGPDGFDVAAITGVDLYNTSIVTKKHSDDLSNEIVTFDDEKLEETSSHDNDRTKRSSNTSEGPDDKEPIMKTFSTLNLWQSIGLLFGRAFDQDLFYWSTLEQTKEDENEKTPEIAFDTPFVWYLHDDTLGPIFMGAVNSIENLKKSYYSEPLTRVGFATWAADMDVFPLPRCTL